MPLHFTQKTKVIKRDKRERVIKGRKIGTIGGMMGKETCIGLATILFLCIPYMAVASPYKDALARVRCQLHSYKVTVAQPGCETKDVWVNTCVGVCIAASVPSSAGSLQSRCDSCKVKESVEIFVELSCKGSSGSFTKFHPMKAAKACHCSLCWKGKK